MSASRWALAALLLVATGCRARAPNAVSARASEPFALAEIERDATLTPSDAIASPAEVLAGDRGDLRVRLGAPAEETGLPLIPIAPQEDGRSIVLAVEWRSPSVAFAGQVYSYPLVALREPFVATSADIERVEIVESHEYVCQNDLRGHTAWHLRVVPSARVRAELGRRLAKGNDIAVLVHGRVVSVATSEDHVDIRSYELRDAPPDERAFLEATAHDLCRIAACPVTIQIVPRVPA